MKFFNKRPILFFALVMVIAMVVVIYHNFFALKLAFFVCAAVIFMLGVVLFILLKNKTAKFILSRAALMGLAILISVGSVSVASAMFYRDYEKFDDYAIVSGRICDAADWSSSSYKALLLDTVHIKAENFEKDLHGKVLLTVEVDENDQKHFEIGTKLSVYAKISFADLYYYGENGLSFYYKNKNIVASGFGLESNIVTIDDTLHLHLDEIIKQKIQNIMQENLDPEYVGIAVGMLYGDKSILNEQIKQDFSGSGIGHILAVSGLHVGFVVGLLLALCKLIRVRGYLRFALIAIFLGFYAYLCGFSVSVLRAIIMALCFLLASCVKRKYDMLNALSLAFVILACIDPFSITTIGFQLSFSAVLSICLLSKPLTNVFSKFLYRKLASTIAVLICVQIGTIPVMISAFNHITLTAVVSNFVCLPVASVAYMVLYVLTIIALICPPISIVVYLFQAIMQIVVKFVHIVAPYGIMELMSWKGEVLSVATIVSMYFSSQYLFFNKKVKTILCLTLWSLCCVVLLC